MLEQLKAYLLDAFAISALDQAEKLIIEYPEMGMREITVQSNNFKR